MTSASAKLRIVEAPDPNGGPLELEDAFRQLAPYVASIGFRILGRKDEVDDLVQDVFLTAAKGLESIRDPRATKAWLATVTVRTARRKLRKRRFVMLFTDTDADYLEVADERASPEIRALLSNVYRALDRIAVDDRIAWTLRNVEGERLEAIALLCDCSLATVKRRIARAHDAIQKELRDG